MSGAGRTALFLPGLHGGGAERVMVQLAASLAGQGVPVDLVVASAVGPYLKDVPAEVRLVDLGAGRVSASLPRLAAYLRRTRPRALLSTLEHANVVAGSLNSLELRLMELARVLAGKPKLLLMDETLAGLGAEEVETMLAVIRRLANEGQTIVIIEHTMQAMVRIADRFVVLDHGSVLAVGKPMEVTKDPLVIEAYLGKKWMDHAKH